MTAMEGRTKMGEATDQRMTNDNDRFSLSFSLSLSFGTYWWMCGLVGVDVVSKTSHKVKRGHGHVYSRVHGCARIVNKLVHNLRLG